MSFFLPDSLVIIMFDESVTNNQFVFRYNSLASKCPIMRSNNLVYRLSRQTHILRARSGRTMNEKKSTANQATTKLSDDPITTE